MADNGSQPSSSLLQYLPAIYQQDAFIGQFLLAFEKILLGRQDGVSFPSIRRDSVDVNFPEQGLEETIADLATYFDPKQTPEDFLLWLAGWTAFSLRADLPPDKQRDFIADIIPLYRSRGTKQNLQDLLAIFADLSTPTITEAQGSEFQVGVHSTVGVDAQLGGGPPHFFRVIILLPRTTQAVVDRQMAIARALIELEKPAHTYYELDVLVPSMQVGVHSTVGVDTLLGSAL